MIYCKQDICRNSSSAGKTVQLFAVPPGGRYPHGINYPYLFIYLLLRTYIVTLEKHEVKTSLHVQYT